MTPTRRYDSPRRRAQATATRNAIVEAFIEQLQEPGREELSPQDAAERAGVSVRTVHGYFPDRASRLDAIADWVDSYTYPGGVPEVGGPDGLVSYFIEIHTQALASPLTRALLQSRHSADWQEIRQRRRAGRLDEIRKAVEAIGAPPRETRETTAMLLRLAGADASLPLHDTYGIPLNRVPAVIANTVELLVEQLRRADSEP